MNPTIVDFFAKQDECRDIQIWALSTGVTTMAELWTLEMNPEWRVWIATQKGVLSDRDLRLFACWCVRQVWHLLDDARSRRAVEVAERYAVGEATDKELAAARDAAYAAARDALWSTPAAMGAVEQDAARVAESAAWSASSDAHFVVASAREATWVAERDAARTARVAESAAWSAARSEQSAYLRKFGNPFKA